MTKEKIAPEFKFTKQERKDLSEAICTNIAVIRVKADTFGINLNKTQKTQINRLINLKGRINAQTFVW